MQSGLITSLTPPPPSTEGDRPDHVYTFHLEGCLNKGKLIIRKESPILVKLTIKS